VPLGVHALSLLPELSDDDVKDLQRQDSVLGIILDWLQTDFQPTVDDLRQLPLDGRKLWSIRADLAFINCSGASDRQR